MSTNDMTELNYQPAAVEALTAAARDQEDFSGWLALVLATVAANLGSAAALTAGRVGSWEAAHVRDLLTGTVGYDDEFLVQYRTAPVEVVESPEATFWDFDADRYEESADFVEQAILDEVPEPCDGETFAAAMDRAAQAVDAVLELKQDDLAAYREAFEAQVRAAAEWRSNDGRQTGVPHSIPVTVRFVDWDKLEDRWGDGRGDAVAYALWGHARINTPLPATGKTPAEEPQSDSSQLIWPHLRIPSLSHIGPPSTDDGRSS
jgi:hypothetical protein